MKTYILNFIRPMSTDEDTRRREFIFTVLIVSVILLFFFAVVNSTITVVFISDEVSRSNNALSFGVLFTILAFLVGLYILARRGFINLASYIFIAAIGFFAAYLGYRWGVDVNASLLLYALTIVMSGVLISTRFAFITTGLVAAVMIFLGSAQFNGVIEVNQYWREEEWTHTDTAVTAVIFFVIATVSWLSNREIEKSLERARASEKALTKERNTLEERVIERTEELKKAELEKMSHVYRLVEFGKLTSGLVHDLINPLNTLSLNIESIARKQGGGELAALSADVDRAQRATTHMRTVVDSIRKHLVREQVWERFSACEIITNAVHVLTHYAKTRQVELTVKCSKDVDMYGDVGMFTQIVTNLISNAIESYPASADAVPEDRPVRVTIAREGQIAHIAVSDNGMGIPKETMDRIFEPFFTTKSGADGLGIGLSLVKRAIEKDFNGTLTVTSSPGVGSIFTVRIPLVNNHNERAV